MTQKYVHAFAASAAVAAGIFLSAGSLPVPFSLRMARADNPYLSDIQWGFDKDGLLYLSAHADRDLSGAQVALTIGSTTLMSGSIGRNCGSYCVPAIVPVQDVAAGQDITFYFPYAYNKCGGPWVCDVIIYLSRQSLFDHLGLDVGSSAIGRVRVADWQDDTDYPEFGSREPVVIIPGIFGSVHKGGRWILQPVFDPYGVLESTLEKNGYVRGKTMFDFAYDWEHADLPTLARRLADEIQQIKSTCGCEKVDIVAHSMGGLVARAYVESGSYQGDIDHLIFLGTPQLGAPLDYAAWEGGTPLFRGELDLAAVYLSSVMHQEALEAGFGQLGAPGDVAIFNYIHSSSSPVFAFRELLPTFDYLRDANDGELRTYPNGYPENGFLDVLNSSSSLALFRQSGVRAVTIYSGDRPDTLDELHVGRDSSTLPLWSDGFPEDFEFGAGDGTVPLRSALGIGSDGAVRVGGTHLDLPAAASGEVVRMLTGVTDPVLAPPRSMITRILTIFSLSPVDILVTTPDGSMVGEDLSTGQEVDQVDGAFYSGAKGSGQYIFIPDPEDGRYVVTAKGTGTGQYHILASYGYETAAGATSSDAVFEGNTLPGLAEDLDLFVDPSAPAPIVVAPRDAAPPEISHSALDPRYFLNAVPIPFVYGATDAGSGVFSISSTLDGVPLPSGAVIDFNVPGVHTVGVVAEDFMGNVASASISYDVAYRFAGFLPPIRSDGSGVYNLGRTLPVKFQLADEDGNPVAGAAARITVTSAQAGAAVPLDASASSADGGGGVFRYDGTGDQYVYNLDTGRLGAGAWKLDIGLDDGNDYAIPFSLK